jgi:hypothetical protein
VGSAQITGGAASVADPKEIHFLTTRYLSWDFLTPESLTAVAVYWIDRICTPLVTKIVTISYFPWKRLGEPNGKNATHALIVSGSSGMWLETAKPRSSFEGDSGIKPGIVLQPFHLSVTLADDRRPPVTATH